MSLQKMFFNLVKRFLLKFLRFLCTLIIVLVLLYIVKSFIVFLLLKQKIIPEEKSLVNSKPKVILFWTKLFKHRYFDMPNETNYEDYLKFLKCPVTNCIMTHDKNYLSEPHLYDALVFHGGDPWLITEGVPKTRSPNQIYVFLMME